jgi:hypothetical protein
MNKIKFGHVPINVLSINIRGLRSKVDELSLFLEEENIDICAIQETKLKNNLEFNFKSYIAYYLHHFSETSRGGTTLLIKKHIKHKIISKNYVGNSEFFTIKIFGSPKDMLIHSVYQHPTELIDTNKYKSLISNNLFNLIIGDLNATHNLIKGKRINHNGKLLFELLLDSDLMCLNNDTPTFYHVNGKYFEILDYALITSNFYSYIDKFSVLEDVGSDHLPILIKFKSINTRQNVNNSSNKHQFNYNKANWSEFKKLIKKKSTLITNTNDVEELNNQIMKVILDAATKAIPTKKLVTSTCSYPKYIINMIKKRRYLHRKYIKKRDPELKKIVQ